MTDLYHYTDAEAARSILQTGTVWLTDLRFMNDSVELQHGIDFFNEAMRHQPYGLFYDGAYASKAIDYLTAGLNAYKDAENWIDPLFAASFSEVDDLLSQWRAYGGYSIGFDPNRLQDHNRTLKQCIYQNDLKKNRAITDISDAVAKVSNDMAKNDGCIGINSLDASTALIKSAATFKHSGFSEEREVRMTAYATGNDILYRSRQGLLVPYIKIEVPLDAITSIRIGPIRHQNLAFASMRMLIDDVLKKFQSDGGDVEWYPEIIKSGTPYRN